MKKPIPYGKYHLLERINVGGMAEVFLGKASGFEEFDRLVAIKRILPAMMGDSEFITMFLDEARISVQLNHANIVQVYELGKQDDSYYIAMEYVSGKDLRHLLEYYRSQGTAMPVLQAAFITSKICEGLDYAHRKKDLRGKELRIIHRDVSPQNILLTYDGEVKIIDFGIAKAANRAQKTEAGTLKGKFGYMSPEQVRGFPDVDRRADVFAVGVILYEMITGERLFVGGSDFSTLEKVRVAEIPPPRKVNADIPVALEKVVLKALAREVGDRYAWCSDLQEDLMRFAVSAGSVYSGKNLAAFMREVFTADMASEQKRLELYAREEPPDRVHASGVVASLPAPPSDAVAAASRERDPASWQRPMQATLLLGAGPGSTFPEGLPYQPVLPPPGSDAPDEQPSPDRTEIINSGVVAALGLDRTSTRDPPQVGDSVGPTSARVTPRRSTAFEREPQLKAPGADDETSDLAKTMADLPPVGFANGLGPPSRDVGDTVADECATTLPPTDVRLEGIEADFPAKAGSTALMPAPSLTPPRHTQRPTPPSGTQRPVPRNGAEPPARPKDAMTPVDAGPRQKASRLPLILVIAGAALLVVIVAVVVVIHLGAGGTLLVTVSGPEANKAQVVLDGKTIVTPGETIALSAGKHEVTAEADGFERDRQIVEIRRNAKIPLDFQLVPKRSPAVAELGGGPKEPAADPKPPQQNDRPDVVLPDLRIESSPSGAEVEINGQKVGRTPKTIIGIDPTTVGSVSVSLTGYRRNSKPVEWDGQSRVISLAFFLEKSEAPRPIELGSEPKFADPQRLSRPDGQPRIAIGKGKLVTISSPVAKVSVDGKDTGRWTPIPPAQPLEITSGQHTIVYTASDGRRATRRVTVVANETVKIVGVNDFK